MTLDARSRPHRGPSPIESDEHLFTVVSRRHDNDGEVVLRPECRFVRRACLVASGTGVGHLFLALIQFAAWCFDRVQPDGFLHRTPCTRGQWLRDEEQLKPGGVLAAEERQRRGRVLPLREDHARLLSSTYVRYRKESCALTTSALNTRPTAAMRDARAQFIENSSLSEDQRDRLAASCLCCIAQHIHGHRRWA